MIDEEFQGEGRNLRVVEFAVDDDHAVRGVEVSQHASRTPQAPADLHPPQAAGEVTSVEAAKHRLQIVDLAAWGDHFLRSPLAAHPFGSPLNPRAGHEDPVIILSLPGARVAINAADQYLRQGLKNQRWRTLENIRQPDLNPIVVQVNDVPDSGEGIEVHLKAGHRSPRPHKLKHFPEKFGSARLRSGGSGFGWNPGLRGM